MTHAANTSLDIRLAFIALGTKEAEGKRSFNHEVMFLFVQYSIF